VNGDFESGDVGFTTQYIKHSTAPDVGCGTCFRDWSNPNEYEVVTNVTTQFHSGFPNISDHTPGPGNHFMAVDGACDVGRKVWCQTVNIIPNTNYYFTMWYTSLHSSNPALLQFEINGINVGLQRQLSTTVGLWEEYTFNWFSGATSGNVSICIENMTVVGCNNGNDFAIDDIAFTAGCAFAEPGPQPNLGPDRSICIEGTPITLNSGLSTAAGRTFTWSTGATGTGAGAPNTLNVSAPGTYSVCVTESGSCVKSDIVVVTNSFSVDLGPDVVLCNPTTATLNAGITAPGVSYVWKRNGAVISGATSQTYTALGPGLYRVEVTIPSCGMQFDEVNITTQAATPNNATFCPPGAANLSVTGSGTYEWYSAQTGGSLLATGSTYNPTPGATTTYWVKDVSTFSYTFGPTSKFPNGFGLGASANEYIVFDAFTSFRIDAVTVYAKVYNVNESFTIGVTLRNSAGTLLAQVVRTVIGPPYVPAGNDWPFVIPVGINVPAGTNYRLSNEGTSVGQIFFAQGGGNSVNWASYQVPGVARLVGPPLNGNYGWCGTECYGFFYNWEISAGVDCERVPVVATYNCPSPVTLLHFRANEIGEDVLLQWATSSEINSSHFVVQRSTDGINFISIGTVPSQGNSSSTVTYTFTDYEAQDGISYYRLVQYDLDGTNTNSKLVSVEFKDPGVIVSPNPTHGQFTVSFTAKKDESVRGQLFNTLGELVLEEVFHFSNGNFSRTINISHLASAVYYLKISGGSRNSIVKIVKE
jgi:hypothetical protein